MRKLKIVVIDLVTRGPTRALYPRIMHPNLASIMPQVIAVWCEEAGHEVTFVCYTGLENLLDELPHDVDLGFIGAFTHDASRRVHTPRRARVLTLGTRPVRTTCSKPRQTPEDGPS